MGTGLVEVAEGSKRDVAGSTASPWRDYYLIELADSPIASYAGGTAGLAPTNPQISGDRRVDLRQPAVQEYRAYLQRRQDEVLAAIEQTLGKSVAVLRRYDAAFNGFAIPLRPEEAERVRGLRGVVKVYRNEFRELLTDHGPGWIGAPGIWNGTTTGGLPGTRGEGVIVGIIDSGINSDHPSFADIGGDGHNHTNPLGAGTYRGWCNPGFPVLMTCNDKLIGMWSYPESGNNPEDTDGHGSHTAGTSAGNVVTAALIAPTTSATDDISGVAPHANIIAYDACLGTCPQTALVAAVNQAVLDGVDVINYSISGGNDPYNDAVSTAFLNATAAGVFVSASAGNDGPGASTVGHSEPWVQTVAASTHDRKIINRLINKTGGNTTPPPDFTGEGFTSGFGPAPIVYAGAFGNPLCPLGAFPPGTFSGQIVVCDRGGGIGRVDKAQSVLNGGAGGFVLANDATSGNSLVGDSYPLPGVHIRHSDGVILKTWLATGSGHMATITGRTFTVSTSNADIMAAFSSRGPGGILRDVLKPDVTAPGVNIWAADNNGPTPPEYQLLSGTSMSSPHSAGAGALIRALHPTWTPPMVKSAIMMTTVTGVRKEDETTPATPFDMGAGRIDLSKAALPGFVLDETQANFTAANPSTGGDPASLNLASLTDLSCFLTCSWSRTVRSVAGSSKVWTGTVSAPSGVVVNITSPNPFSLPTMGSTAPVDVTVDVTSAAKNQFYFASITWSDGPGGSPDLRVPITVFAQGSTDPLSLTKTVDAPVTSPGGTLNYTVVVANRSSTPANFTVTDPVPPNTTFVPGSATGGWTHDSGTNTLSGMTGVLAGLQPTVTTSPSPFGYVPPASLFGVTNICTLTAACDETVLTLTGLDFFYLGQHYTQAKIVGNGYIQPGNPATGSNLFINQNLPDPTDPDNVIAGFWADLDMNGTSPSDPGGGFYYFASYEDPGSADIYTVLGWEDAQLFGDPTRTYTFQIWIKDGTDQIWFVYQELNGGLPIGADGGLTVGAENGDGTAGQSYFYRPLGSCLPGCPADQGTPPVVGTDLKVNSLAASATFTFAVTVNGGASAGTQIHNVVTATDGTRTFQAVADSIVSAGGTVSVSATKTVAGDFAPGRPITYTVVLSNGGSSAQLDNPGDEFVDILPASLTLVSASPTSGTANANVGTNTVTWNGSIPPAGSVTITINATIKLLTGGTQISNQGTVFFDADNTGTNESSALTDDPGQPGPSNPTSFTVALGRSLFTVAPCRVVDTRNTAGPYGGPALAPNAARTFTIKGQCGIPLSARAIAGNVTAVPDAGVTIADYRLYPGGGSQPLVSTLNFRGGQIRANNFVVVLGNGGNLTVHYALSSGSATSHLLIDVVGYFE